MRLRGPVLGVGEPAEHRGAFDHRDLFGAQVTVRDLLAVQHRQRVPHPRDRGGVGAPKQVDALGGVVCIQRPAALERRHRDRRGVRQREVTDGDGHQRAMFHRPAHRGLDRRRLAVAQPDLAPELSQKAATPLMRTVQLDHGGARLVAVAGIAPRGQQHGATTGRAQHSQRRHREPAARHRPHRTVQRHLQGRRAHHQHHQRPDEPADGQTQQRTGRYDGADDQMDRYERQQQRPPPVPPAGRQPRPGHRQHRRQHRDPPRVVEELRQHRVQAVGQIEVPAWRGDAVSGDRQQQQCDESGRGVGAQQLPLP